ncbi:hypothetical protein U0070_009243 [Myodes glareolus]|uniref:Uncharacterized protein n=1 Tax=Myodes glareolus TaxID=447135 RepID=A0AAW0IR82_MYOGA
MFTVVTRQPCEQTGFRALSRTPAIVTLVVLLVSIVVLVTLTLIQIRHPQVLPPGLKVSQNGPELSAILKPLLKGKLSFQPPAGESSMRPMEEVGWVLGLWCRLRSGTFSRDWVALF